MSAFNKKSVVLIPAMLALVISAGLSAQVQVTPPKHRTVGKITFPVATTLHRARAQGLRDNGQSALDVPMSAGWALAGFGLTFDNGDHKLRRIGVLGGERFARFVMADQNGDDPFSARAHFSGLDGIKVQEISATGGGKFDIRLPGEAPKDSTLVLSGFEFRRADGSDANLRNIGLWLDGSRNAIRVSLTDDQGLDFRGLEATLAAMAASTVVPLPGLLETTSHVAAAQLGARGIKSMVGKYRGYRVTVQYAWVPNAKVAQRGALSGTDHKTSRPPSSRIDALQGFEFTFNNSDHHLLGLGLNAGGRGEVMFQDGNTDDPMQWSATYVTLR